MNRLAYVVPTKDRPVDLRKMLESLARQTRLPDQVIVVDGSVESVEPILKSFVNLNFLYVRVFPPSLAKQRNAGMAQLEDGITVAGYLDDDVVLEPDATAAMYRFWESAGPKVGGASFSMINQPSTRSNWVLGLFRIGGSDPGRMLSSGFQCQIPFVEKTIQTDWLYGGATMWRREAIREFSFDEWYIGTGHLEDVDYSFRVSRKYELYVVGDARLNHYSHPIPIEKNFIVGKQQVVNRTYFVRKMGCFSKPLFAWGLCGLFVHNLLSSVARRDSAGIRRAQGNLSGFWDLLGGRNKQVPGHFK